MERNVIRIGSNDDLVVGRIILATRAVFRARKEHVGSVILDGELEICHVRLALARCKRGTRSDTCIGKNQKLQRDPVNTSSEIAHPCNYICTINNQIRQRKQSKSKQERQGDKG